MQSASGRTIARTSSPPGPPSPRSPRRPPASTSASRARDESAPRPPHNEQGPPVTSTLNTSSAALADAERVRKDDRAHVFHSWSAQAQIDPLPIASASGSYR